MPDKNELVEMLFDSLAAAYAGQWLAKWEGFDMEMVKAIWAKQMEGLKVRHIKHGLAHLPTDHPPNAMRFREICLQAPEPHIACLPEPYCAPDPARVAEILKPLREAVAEPTDMEKKWWKMRDAEVNNRGVLPTGQRMTHYHRKAWRAALRHGEFAVPGSEGGEHD